MSRDVLTVGSTMRIPLLYRGEYSQWVERFMNYLEEQTDGEAMINSIKNGDQPLPRVTQVSIAGTSSTEQPPLKEKSIWSDQEKRIQKINRLARSLLIQGLPNDIYSLIDSNKTANDLWDALARHMLGLEYGEQDRKAAVLYEYETFKATEGELCLTLTFDTYKFKNDVSFKEELVHQRLRKTLTHVLELSSYFILMIEHEVLEFRLRWNEVVTPSSDPENRTVSNKDEFGFDIHLGFGYIYLRFREDHFTV
nr:ribonuclease H-like domain-containing protein [Tanacetum cinerariifolium]GEZ94438.1 ribonuclease H-like domain-containing protein [Tanacetum cinerariifolium]